MLVSVSQILFFFFSCFFIHIFHILNLILLSIDFTFLSVSQFILVLYDLVWIFFFIVIRAKNHLLFFFISIWLSCCVCVCARKCISFIAIPTSFHKMIFLQLISYVSIYEMKINAPMNVNGIFQTQISIRISLSSYMLRYS